MKRSTPPRVQRRRLIDHTLAMDEADATNASSTSGTPIRRRPRYWHSQGIETVLAYGKRNPAAGIMLALLAEIAPAEVEMLRERMNSGLAEARCNGVMVGRPPRYATMMNKHKGCLAAVEGGTIRSEYCQDYRQRQLFTG